MLLSENSDQETINQNLEMLRLTRKPAGRILNFSDLEFGFYLCPEKKSKNDPFIVDVDKKLAKIRGIIPDEIYNLLLEKSIKGEINSNEVYNALSAADKRSVKYINYNNGDWTLYALNLINTLEGKN